MNMDSITAMIIGTATIVLLILLDAFSLVKRSISAPETTEQHKADVVGGRLCISRLWKGPKRIDGLDFKKKLLHVDGIEEPLLFAELGSTLRMTNEEEVLVGKEDPIYEYISPKEVVNATKKPSLANLKLLHEANEYAQLKRRAKAEETILGHDYIKKVTDDIQKIMPKQQKGSQ